MVLSENHQLMRKVFRQFAENEFTPALLDRLDETGEFDRDIHRKMSGAGFMGVKIPVKYGGQGGDTLAHVLLVEEFARISPVLSIYANTSNSLGSGPLPATAMKTLDGGRLGMAAQALGIAQGCLDEAVAYAKTRKQFGRAISNFQGVSFMIADMATELEAARELVYNTAVMKDAGAKDAGMRCSMSKYYAAEAYTAAVCQVVEKGMPDTLLVSAATIGRDLAPRCAARLQTGLNADCTLLHVGRQEYLDYLARESSQDLSEIEGKVTDNQLKMTMPAFGGHLMATITCPNYRPQMATVRPGVMKAGEYSEEAAAPAYRAGLHRALLVYVHIDRNVSLAAPGLHRNPSFNTVLTHAVSSGKM